MCKPLAVLRSLVGKFSRGEITLTADYRFNISLNSLKIKLQGSEHGSMVGYSHGIHSEIAHTVQKMADSYGSVKKTVLGMHMKMDKRRKHI